MKKLKILVAESIEILIQQLNTFLFYFQGNAARAMMFSLGCIQSLKCNTNQCPTGIATQDRELMRGLDVENKGVRVYK